MCTALFVGIFRTNQHWQGPTSWFMDLVPDHGQSNLKQLPEVPEQITQNFPVKFDKDVPENSSEKHKTHSKGL